MSFFEFPHSRTYDSDLGWLIKHFGLMSDQVNTLETWAATHKTEYDDLKDKVDGLINNLVDVISPWDSSIAYHIFSIVEYQGTNYIAIQDVPVGAMITNTEYWQPANTALEQINAIGNVVDEMRDSMPFYYVILENYGGVVDDPNTDNTPALVAALQDLHNKNGGVLMLNTGHYYFATPVVIDFFLYGIKVIGVSRGAINSDPAGEGGTFLNYTGSGMFMTFNNKVQDCLFEDFSIYLADNAYGMQFNLTSHLTYFDRLLCSGGKGFLDFNTGTYTKIIDCAYSTGVASVEYGIRIGHSETHYTTEFFYISRTSIDFQRIGAGDCIIIERMEGGLWLDRLDLCNTNGRAFYLHNLSAKTIAYFNISNINVSGANICVELFADTGTLAGVFIDNCRFAVNKNTVDDRIIYTHATTGNVDLHLSKTYLRSRNGEATPTYLCEFRSLEANSEIDLAQGESFDIPCFITSAVKKYHDYRIKTNYTFRNGVVTAGQHAIPLSTLHCLVTPSSNYWHPGLVSSNGDIAYIKTTYENGIPTANILVGTAPTNRVTLHIEEEIITETTTI